jgi:hypothetical protein
MRVAAARIARTSFIYPRMNEKNFAKASIKAGTSSINHATGYGRSWGVIK